MVQQRYQTATTLYPYAKLPDAFTSVKRHPVVVVGGGPVGLALALDLGQKGTPVLVLDDHEGPGIGSKAICFAKRTLDIATRLGAAKPMVDKGVVWNVGRVFHGDGEIFKFDLQPESGHRNPAFINLQQPYFEEYLVDAIRTAQSQGAPIELRGRNEVVRIENKGEYVSLDVKTPDGSYTVEADYLVACDGARSPLRSMMDLSFDGRVFEDNFLIADVKMKADFPTERWFWFQPPFKNSGQSALLHKQPDDIWRIDFQLGWEIDREKELEPSRIRARVDAMLSSQTGVVPDYELEWTSIYTFQCRRMKAFRHGRVFFAGDSAHQVSPFGARGANSGVQDAENLAWKLDLVLKGQATDELLDTYAEEREFGADENILNSSRATDFMTPKTEISTMFRDAVLELAGKYDFARAHVNSGRLSQPCTYDGFSLFDQDHLNGPHQTRPGSPCCDATHGNAFLLDEIKDGFTLLAINTTCESIEVEGIKTNVLEIPSPSEEIKARYLGNAETAVYLIRPDQHIAGRWPKFDRQTVEAAVKTAIGLAS